MLKAIFIAGRKLYLRWAFCSIFYSKDIYMSSVFFWRSVVYSTVKTSTCQASVSLRNPTSEEPGVAKIYL